jgi:TolB-like protein
MQNRGAKMLRLSIFGRFRAADALGNEIPIKSKKARALLAYLALPPGKERSREEVMALLWSERGDEQARSSLRQALSGLRKELGEIADGVLKVTDEWLSLDPGLVAIEPASPGDVLLSGLHISDPAFDEWLRDERLRHEDTLVADAQPPELLLPDKPSIAVLPFTNLSPDPEQEYFSDGITEDIITELTRFPSLFVIARNSSFAYKGQSVNVAKIGQELGVAYIVEGSVRKAGNRVRISAQLVEAESGNHLWAERYDRELEGIFAVQDEVVREVAAAVPGQLDAIAAQRARRRPVENLTAYDYVLRGEWYLNQEYASPAAVPLFEKAIEIDPQCARAYTWLANFHAYRVFKDAASIEEAARMARSLAERALQIDPADPAVQAIAAEAYYMVGELDLARRHIEIAIKLNPNSYVVMQFAGYVLAYLGDHEEGLRWLHRLSRHDPAGSSGDALREGYFDLFYMARRYEDAIEAFRGWRNPQPHMYLELAAAFAQLDRIDDVRTTVAQFEQIRPEGFDPVKVAHSHAKTCARQEDADHWLEGYRKAGLDV